jgi:hypothetical protein
MARAHQAGEGVFRSILPEDIDWQPFPAFPPSARLAVLVGQPSEPGLYVIRVKVPGGVKLMPHKHPEDRIYTVMSGVFYIVRYGAAEFSPCEGRAPRRDRQDRTGAAWPDTGHQPPPRRGYMPRPCRVQSPLTNTNR